MDKLDRFVSDFVREMTEEDAGMIEYIVLSGSAARGDFRAGTSDIDLIIKTSDAAHIRPVFARAERAFWSLDDKYDMNQRELFEHKKDAMLIPLGRGQRHAVSVFSRHPEKSVRAYFDLFLDHKAIQIHHEQIDLLKQFVEIATAKFRAGTGSQVDVLKAQV